MPSCNALATEQDLFVTFQPSDGCLPAALPERQKGAQNTLGWKFLPTEPYGHKQITLWAAFINNFQICSSWSVGSFKTWLIYFLQPWKGGIGWNPNAQHIPLNLSNEATCISLASHTHTHRSYLLGRVLERLTGQLLDGALAGDQVSQLLGWLQKLSRMEKEGRIFIIIRMKTKGWATILFELQQEPQ